MKLNTQIRRFSWDQQKERNLRSQRSSIISAAHTSTDDAGNNSGCTISRTIPRPFC